PSSPAPAPPSPPPAPAATTPIARMVQAGWNLAQLERLGRMTGRMLIPTRTNSIYIDDDAQLIGVQLQGGQAVRFRVRRQDGSEVTLQNISPTGASLDAPQRIAELQSIAIESAIDTAVTTSLTLQLNLFGTLTTIDVPIQIQARRASVGLQEC